MKRLKHRVVSAFSACVCFFLVTLSGGFAAIADTEAGNAPVLERGPVAQTLELSTSTPVPAPTLSPMPTPTPRPTVSPTPTLTPTPSVSPTPTLSPTPTPSPTPKPYAFNKAIANVNDFVNVREGASTDTPLVGKLYTDGIADVLGTEGDWTHISSGNVTGYIRSDYLYLEDRAIAYADKITAYNAKVIVGSMNVRSGPSTESDKLGGTYTGDTYPAILSLSNEEWIAVQYDADTVAYLYAEYVSLICNQKEALTMEEIAAAERAAKIEKARVDSVPITYRDPITLTEEDLEVFALVVAAEAYWEPYEGKVAVANVILNRLLTGKYGNTVYGVVTAPGQFEGYKHIEKYRTRDLTDCYKACREALSGKNNIGDYYFFHADYYVDATDEWIYFTSWYRIDGHIFFNRRW